MFSPSIRPCFLPGRSLSGLSHSSGGDSNSGSETEAVKAHTDGQAREQAPSPSSIPPPCVQTRMRCHASRRKKQRIMNHYQQIMSQTLNHSRHQRESVLKRVRSAPDCAKGSRLCILFCHPLPCLLDSTLLTPPRCPSRASRAEGSGTAPGFAV